MRTSRVVVHKSMVGLIYINTPACSALVGPDTSALPAATLVFNFSDDVGAAPPPEKAHHTGHRCQCKPQVLAVSCYTNNAVFLSGVVADTHTRARDWTGPILMVAERRFKKLAVRPAAPCSSQDIKGQWLIGSPRVCGLGQQQRMAALETAPPRFCGPRELGKSAQMHRHRPTAVWNSLDPRPMAEGRPMIRSGIK